MGSYDFTSSHYYGESSHNNHQLDGDKYGSKSNTHLIPPFSIHVDKTLQELDCKIKLQRKQKFREPTMPLFNTNFAGFSLTVSTLMRNPSLLIPHLTIPTFLQLPEDLSYHLIDSVAPEAAGARPPTIRALVIDKDNTLTPPHKTTFPTEYYDKLKQLRTSESSPFNMHTNPDGILIVSNTAGSNPRSKRYEEDARKLEEYLGKLNIKVFRSPAGASAVKKPLSYAAVLEYLKGNGVVNRADEVAVVGDRVGTDVLMASLMGSWSIWTRDGVTQDMKGREGKNYRGTLAGVERYLVRKLQRSGVVATLPKSWQHL